MPTLTQATPKYRKHRASGQAIVTIEGHDFYLGFYGSRASKLEYDRVIAEWFAAGRRLPASSPGASDLTVVEVLARFKKHALKRYQKDGKPTGEWENFRQAFVPFCFSPRDSTRKRLDEMRANRQTRVQPSQVSRARKNPKRVPGERYTTKSYSYAIRRAWARSAACAASWTRRCSS